MCAGRRRPQLQDTARLIRAAGGRALPFSVDVTDPSGVTELATCALKEFGQIDLLFNNAGSFRSVGPAWEADPDVWWQDVTTNLLGPVLCCRAVLPHMIKRRRGVIINMDGGGGGCGPDIVVHRLEKRKPRSPCFSGPNLGGSAYGCSKAALMRYTEGLARELELVGSPVLVFGLNPGFVRTQMTEHLIASRQGRRWQAFVGKLFEHQADRPPADCATATMSLLRIAGPEINGCVFDVDTDFGTVARLKQRVMKDALYTMRLRDPRAM